VSLPTAVPRLWRTFLVVPLVALSVAVSANPHHGSSPPPARTLGVGVINLSSEALSARGLEHGVLIQTVAPGSPAAAAGLQAEDVLVEMGGKPVYSAERLQWLVRQATEGEAIPVKLQRGEGLQTTSVAFPVASADAQAAETSAPSGGWPVLGVRFQPMTPDLRAAFGAPEDVGVLVAEVMGAGAAEKAGVTAGDIIVRIDRRVIRSAHDVHRALGFFNPGESVELELVRGGQRRVVTAQLGGAGGDVVGKRCDGHGPGAHPVAEPHGWRHPGHGHP
jgi:S1-C subfamily serine protease